MSTEPAIALDPNWPKVSIEDATETLTAPGSKFEMETVTIRGVPTRVWKNAPRDLGQLLDLSRTHGERTFTVLDDERVDYEANFRATATLAHALRDMGVGKGDRVAFAMRNLPEWPVVFFAITTIGAIAVPLNAWWTGAELEYGIRDSGAKVLIVDAERHARLRDHLPALSGLERLIVARSPVSIDGTVALEDLIGAPAAWADLPDRDRPRVEIDTEDDATIFYTSGTTGNPKGALGTHRNLMTNIMSSGFSSARSFLRRGEAIPDPTPRTALTVIPMFHVTACSAGLMGTMASGGTSIFMRKWEPVPAMEIIQREKVHFTGGVPTIAWQLLEHPERHKYDLSSIEAIAYGGAPSAPELVKKIYEEFGALPGNGWGMTETMATVTHHGGEDYLNRPTSAGPPVAVADLEIRAD
ncbi:MAG: fatty acid--CoA ligase, partial [Sphingomonas bacterium]|nr:fatty acid--CoA ligase [Sphingomonas bacterium]